VTRAVILEWKLQTLVEVPALVNLNEKLWFCPSEPLSHCGPVVVCASLSKFVHLTVVPTGTVMVR
jgi:hypothetical protein